MRHALWWLLLVACAARAGVIEVSEGTNLSVALHPENEFLVVDLLGGLWRLPLSGGAATALLPAGSGAAQPRFDPAGEQIVFQRWENGQWDLWRLTLATGAADALTATEYDEREPEFSRDGGEIVFAGDRAGSYSLWSLELASGRLRQLTRESGDARFPSIGPGGQLAYAHIDADGSEIRILEDGSRGRTLVESTNRLDAPSWRPGGDVLVVNERNEGLSSDLRLYIDADEPVWRELTEGEDVFVGRPAWISAEEYLYAADGALWRRGIGSLERRRIRLFAGIDVATVTAQRRRAPAVGEDAYPVTGINGLVHHGPSGRAAFSALDDLWLVENDAVRRLTDDPLADRSPQFTADGQWLVFATDRDGDMDLWRRRIDSDLVLQITDEPGAAFAPRLSPDGRYIAYLEVQGERARDEAALRLVELARPFDSAVLASGLIDAGEPSWQGSYVRLRARGASGGNAYPYVFVTGARSGSAPAAAELPAPSAVADDPALRWEPAMADRAYVIRAGRLFDGIRSEYSDRVDIHIEGQRITDIVPRDGLPLPDLVIDVRNATVVPGLIDVHAHLDPAAGSGLGKQWLRHGVTTVRYVTPDWDPALARAETWASGRQPGPRLIIAPSGAAAGRQLPAGSPIAVSVERRVLGGLAHALAEQWARDDTLPAILPSVLAGADSGATQWLAVSTLGRSYGDVTGRLRESGAYLATGLGALESALATGRTARVPGAYESILQSAGSIAIGSDAPAVAYGAGFHDELALLSRRGIANDQVLRLATAGGAIALGLSLDLGTLEPGRLADLLVVDGDPLDSLEELRRIEAVVVGGVWYDIDVLEP